MRCIIVLLAVCTVALGYGYWDLFGEGGRVSGLSPVSAALAGATIPVGGSALSIFTNPSALAGAHGSSVSLSGWGTGWREEIYYHYTCVEPYRFNVGSMSPQGLRRHCPSPWAEVSLQVQGWRMLPSTR